MFDFKISTLAIGIIAILALAEQAFLGYKIYSLNSEIKQSETKLDKAEKDLKEVRAEKATLTLELKSAAKITEDNIEVIHSLQAEKIKTAKIVNKLTRQNKILSTKKAILVDLVSKANKEERPLNTVDIALIKSMYPEVNNEKVK